MLTSYSRSENMVSLAQVVCLVPFLQSLLLAWVPKQSRLPGGRQQTALLFFSFFSALCSSGTASSTSGYRPLVHWSVPSLGPFFLSVPSLLPTPGEFFPRRVRSVGSGVPSDDRSVARGKLPLSLCSRVQQCRPQGVHSCSSGLAAGLQASALPSLATSHFLFSRALLSPAFSFPSSRGRRHIPSRTVPSPPVGAPPHLKAPSSPFLSSSAGASSRRPSYHPLLFARSFDTATNTRHSHPFPYPLASLASSCSASFPLLVPHSEAPRYLPAFFPSTSKPATPSLPPAQPGGERARDGKRLGNYPGVAVPSLHAYSRDGSSAPGVESSLFLPWSSDRWKKNASGKHGPLSSQAAEPRLVSGLLYAPRHPAFSPYAYQGSEDLHFPPGSTPSREEAGLRESSWTAASFTVRQQKQSRKETDDPPPVCSAEVATSGEERPRVCRPETVGGVPAPGRASSSSTFSLRLHEGGVFSCLRPSRNCSFVPGKSISPTASVSGGVLYLRFPAASSLFSRSAGWTSLRSGWCFPYAPAASALSSPNSLDVSVPASTFTRWSRLWRSLAPRFSPLRPFSRNSVTPSGQFSHRFCSRSSSGRPSFPAASAEEPGWLARFSLRALCSKEGVLSRCLRRANNFGSLVNNALRQSAVAQLAIVLCAYLFHFAYVSRQLYVLPVELIPNSSGLFHHVQGDSLAGLAALAAVLIFSRKGRSPTTGAVLSRSSPGRPQAAVCGVPFCGLPTSGTACASQIHTPAGERKTLEHRVTAFIESLPKNCGSESACAPVDRDKNSENGERAHCLSHRSTGFPGSDSDRISDSVGGRTPFCGDTPPVTAQPPRSPGNLPTGSQSATRTLTSCTTTVRTSGGASADSEDSGVVRGLPLSLRGLPWTGPFPTPLRSTVLLAALFGSYILSGYVAWGLDVLFYFLHAANLVSLDLCMHRSLQVLVAHLAWVGMGLGLFKVLIENFFGSSSCTFPHDSLNGPACNSPASPESSAGRSAGLETPDKMDAREREAAGLDSGRESGERSRGLAGEPAVLCRQTGGQGRAGCECGSDKTTSPQRRDTPAATHGQGCPHGEPRVSGHNSIVEEPGSTTCQARAARVGEPAFQTSKDQTVQKPAKPRLSFAREREGRPLVFLSWLRHLCKRNGDPPREKASGGRSVSTTPSKCRVSSDRKTFLEEDKNMTGTGEEGLPCVCEDASNERSVTSQVRETDSHAVRKKNTRRLGNCSGAERSCERCLGVEQDKCGGHHRWFTLRWRGRERGGLWAWWAIAGYFISCLCFNVTDLLNDFVFSLFPVHHQGDTIVHQIMNPTINTRWSFLVGALAPCLSAPWWEEMLYRGFCLPLFSQLMPLSAAVVLSSLVFAAHHMNIHTMLPLWVLGAVWAGVYTQSGNLLVTVLIHAMWNSRVFLGNFLDL